MFLWLYIGNFLVLYIFQKLLRLFSIFIHANIITFYFL